MEAAATPYYYFAAPRAGVCLLRKQKRDPLSVAERKYKNVFFGS